MLLLFDCMCLCENALVMMVLLVVFVDVHDSVGVCVVGVFVLCGGMCVVGWCGDG